MGNERRLVILCHLSEREHSVDELRRLVGLSQSALSQHLAKLRRDRLVTPRRRAARGPRQRGAGRSAGPMAKVEHLTRQC
jgi:DNA-binding transcriptional ArsR family regulator